MYLKSLTLKGFKSFASPTTLRFEPGVTCVVGPNGSGKSNVVDALSWVMGEQGAKSLRGGKMEDVIFAGTANRPPLGRAEVSLTIDNSDRALPIDYTEVTISRIMFRSGGSEYSINGSSCRLLDVQELLSDSGIGREMHVIVGQGQLDSILHATPEDRRGFIEEAAGVLKHRKRKEKALRKLDGLTDKMSRLTDLTTELRRQLKPLGRQAEVARRAIVIQTDVRDARLRLLADDLAALTAAAEKDRADEQALRERRTQAEAQLLAEQAREAELLAEAEGAAPETARRQQLWFRLSGLVERFRAIESVAKERANALGRTEEETRPSSDPDRMEADARRLQQEHAELAQATRELTQQLSEASATRAAAEAESSAEERRVEAGQREIASRRERLARLNGRAAAARTRLETREAEITRLEAALADARERSDRAGREFAEREQAVTGLGEGEADLDGQYERCQADADAASQALAALVEREGAVAGERSAVRARLEALLTAVRSRGAAPEELRDHPLVSGFLRDDLHIAAGWELAVSAVLGDLADAAVVGSLDAAVDLVRSGVGAPLVIGDGGPTSDREFPALVSLLSGPDPLVAALADLLDGTIACETLDDAVTSVRSGSRVAVTRAGEVVSATRMVTWDDQEASALELAARIEEAKEQDQHLGHESDQLRFATEHARAELRHREAALAEALRALHESDAALAAVADQLGALGSTMRAARHEAERLAADLASAREAREADRAALEQAAEQLTAAETEVMDEGEARPDRREELAEYLRASRAREMEVRLALRTSEERASGVRRRSEELLATARRERAAAEERERRSRIRRRQQIVAGAVRTAAGRTLGVASELAAAAEVQRQQQETRRGERDRALADLRKSIRATSKVLDDLTNSVHRDEMVRTEQRVRIAQLQDKAMEDFGIEPDALLQDYGPDVPVPPSPRAPGDDDLDEEPQPYPFDRGEQERRLKSAERALALLGKVNPLALEEFAALEERHQFLAAQLDDLRNSREDLLGIVQSVDDRMEQVFAEAYADTADQFGRVFSRLFPGGEGRLILTDPGDMLATGVDVEARPPGKKVKRLSLLSGGERSLTAVAFLVALFKARPSPFYVLDEVEAALDDTNLGRLLEVIDELRTDSQLIVITHQKRTMEAADALYGVSMQGDGVTAVISQRLRESAGV